MSAYRTIAGDVLDAVCFDHYGRQDQVERVLDANPGLAARGPVYPAGILIELPEAPETPVRSPLKLWGRA